VLGKLRRSKPVVWIRTCAELYGIAQLVGAVSGSILLAGVFWALAEVFLSLSVAPKILLSAGVFGVALTVTFAILKVALQRNVSNNQEFFVPQQEVGGVRGSRYYQNQPIYMPDIVRELASGIHKGKAPVLIELVFENCQIHGPAMLKPLHGDTNAP
jgi:hypothetical protein